MSQIDSTWKFKIQGDWQAFQEFLHVIDPDVTDAKYSV